MRNPTNEIFVRHCRLPSPSGRLRRHLQPISGPRPYGQAPAYAAPIYSWTGFYIGGHVGGGISSSEALNGIVTSNSQNGRLLGGVQAGVPAASTLKLPILLATYARSVGDPVRSDTWWLARKLVLDSSNAAANALLVRLGGSTAGGGAIVNGLVAGLGGTATDMYGGYLLEAGEKVLTGARWETPPSDAVLQPSFPRGKQTTPHDLGLVLTALARATAGRGPLAEAGVSQREARVVLWLLVHARYPGLVRPGTVFPVGHKAGWLPDLQHDAALVFTPRGTLAVAVMTYSGSGVAYAASRAYGIRVLRVGLGLTAPARAP